MVSRMASIAAAIDTIRDVLSKSPLGEAFAGVDSSLLEAIFEQGATVNTETEASRFMAALDELIASQPGFFNPSVYDKAIGRTIKDKGLFLLPDLVLAEMDKLKVFTQKPTVASMTKTLYEAGYLVRDPDGRHLKQVQEINGVLARGWMVKLTTLSESVVNEKAVSAE